MEPKSESFTQTKQTARMCELMSGMQPSGLPPLCGLGGMGFSSMSNKTIRRIKRIIKRECRTALRCMCPEDNHLHHLIFSTMLRCMIKGVCKLSGEHGMERGSCMNCQQNCNCTEDRCCCGPECGCSKGCCPYIRPEMDTQIRNYVATICKGFLEHKYKEAKECLNIALNSFKQLNGCLPPLCGQPGKGFIKATCSLVHKLCAKGCCSRENQERIANKFWIEYFKNMEHCIRYKAKRVAQKFMRYTRDKECDDLCKQVGVKSLTRALMFLGMAQKIVIHNMKSEQQKKLEAAKGPETKEELIPQGVRHTWKLHKRFWRRCIRRQTLCFVHDLFKNYAESLRICTGLAKDQVDNFFKENNIHDDYRRVRCISKIVARCMFGTYGEKKTKEAFTESVKKYARGLLINCDKKTLKNCRRKAKLALKLNGVKDEDILYLGARVGGNMCCRQCGKEGYKEEKCLDFTNKWVKDNTSVLTEAVNAARELIKECKELGNNKLLTCFILRKTTLWYLQMNYTGGKFNREDFTNFWHNMVTKNRGLQEQANKLLHEACRIACEGTDIKCEGPELNIMMLTLLDMALPHEIRPYKLMAHSKRFQRMKENMPRITGESCLMCGIPTTSMMGHGTNMRIGMMMSPEMMQSMMPHMMHHGMSYPGMMPGMTHMMGMPHPMQGEGHQHMHHEQEEHH